MKFTIKQFNKQFSNDDSCLDFLFHKKYGKSPDCHKCKKKNSFYRVSTRKCYTCSWCGYQISPTSHTIFHKSSTSLKDWFFAIYLFSVSKNGVSGKELQRQLGVTYKCAWRIAKQFRKLFDEANDLLNNTVEVDETYVGGKAKGKRGRGADKKTSVVGLVERKGSVIAMVTKNTKSSTVMPLINKNIQKDSLVMTDEYRSYNKIYKNGYSHQTVNHGKKEYVKGLAHTNTIEGFWSQLKRSINGTYHAVSPKYLQQYVNEFSYRYNLRKSEYPIFYSMLDDLRRPSQA